ncbi:unnamed protein product [Absidia cylindrospora]
MSCDVLYHDNGLLVELLDAATTNNTLLAPGIISISLDSIHKLNDEESDIVRNTPLTALGTIQALVDYFVKDNNNNSSSNSRRNDMAVTLAVDQATNYLCEDLTWQHYLQHWVSRFDPVNHSSSIKMPISNVGVVVDGDSHPPALVQVKSYARVGLMGNPSDGFFGKTMSLLISNFWAQVTLVSNQYYNNYTTGKSIDDLDQGDATIEIIHKPVTDPNRFASISSLTLGCEQDGYENGDRLLLACCKVFYNYCRQQLGLSLETDVGFRIMFDTNIPRQVGLAGSSAIITACWKSLMQFYGVTSAQIPPEIQANLVLSVEVDELGIAAGLQDRVIQTYGGLVYMDFDKTLMHQIGRGRYVELDRATLPTLYLAYVADPEDSGKVHSTVKQRFLNGDPVVTQAMKQFAALTDKARVALEKGDYSSFGQLMTDNFELRRRTYGDSVVGCRNIQMVDIVRRHGGHAKFSGSGGAIVIYLPDSQHTSVKPLQRDLENEGFVFVKLVSVGSQISG